MYVLLNNQSIYRWFETPCHWYYFTVNGIYLFPLQWRHNQHDSVSIHQPHDCILKRLFGRRSKITSKLRVTGLCPGNSPGTGEIPAQRASNAENVSIWWRHHVIFFPYLLMAGTKMRYQESPWGLSLFSFVIWIFIPQLTNCTLIRCQWSKHRT